MDLFSVNAVGIRRQTLSIQALRVNMACLTPAERPQDSKRRWISEDRR